MRARRHNSAVATELHLVTMPLRSVKEPQLQPIEAIRKVHNPINTKIYE